MSVLPLRFIWLSCGLLALEMGVSGAVAADDSRELGPGREFLPAALTEAGVDEQTGTELPLDLVLQSDTDTMLRLGDLFQDDRPAILSLNYSNCPMLCVLQLNGLVDALRDVDLVAGKDFRVISVSLNPQETPAQAAETKQKYLASYGKKADPAGWHFLTGTEAAITRLATTTGIRYVYLPDKKEYSHPAVFMVVMPSGVISRYHYGIEFPPDTVRPSLVEASEGKIGTAFDQFLLLCFHYDATAGTYAMQARTIMKIGGVAIILLLAILFWVCHRILKHRQSEADKLTQLATAGVDS